MVRLIKDYLIKFFEYAEEPYTKEEPKELNMGMFDNSKEKNQKKHEKHIEDMKKSFALEEAIKELSNELGYHIKESTVVDNQVIAPPKEFFEYVTTWVKDAKKINQELLKEKGSNFEDQSKQIADRIIEILKETKRNGN
tara:strand:- start:2495 stop:2911 length:417 start_codon:yes stop_codon:yes gene_type:complete